MKVAEINVGGLRQQFIRIDSSKKTSYQKISEELPDDIFISCAEYYYERYYSQDLRFADKDRATWMEAKKNTIWFDLRKDENYKYYVVIGDESGIVYVSAVEDFNIEYNGYEFQLCEDNKCYYLGFWLDTDGKILPYTDDDIDYDGLESDSEKYLKEKYTLNEALENLIVLNEN